VSSGDEAQTLGSGEVQALADEFSEGMVVGGSREKCGEAMAQRERDDEFGGPEVGADGAQPGTEVLPDGGGAMD